MRVLGVVTDRSRRGAQVFGTELGERLGTMGFDSTVVALAPGAPDRLKIDVLGARPRSATTLRALRSAMSSADVTIAHGSTTLSACSAAGMGRGRPFVYRQISDPLYWAPSTAKRVTTAVQYRFPAQVVSLSTTAAGVLMRRFGVPAKRITVIPNGVDERRHPLATAAERAEVRQRLGIGAGEPVIGYVGALEREKGVGDLVGVMQAGWRLLVAGDGTARVALERQAAERGVQVEFLGALEDPRPAYVASDVVVLPSWTEQQPAVLIEAALVGTPCIATEVGDVARLMDGRRLGGTVPRRPDALAGAICAVLAEGRLPEAAAADREVVLRRYSMHVVAAQWRDLLTSMDH